MTTSEMKVRLARLLMEKSYRVGEITLTSGKKSDYYFDCKQTALYPEGGWLIGKLFLEMLAGSDVVGVGGMTLGADPLVSAVSVLSYEEALRGGKVRPMPAFIIRKQSKGHGTNQFLEGMTNFQAGDRVALLEDVVTTGGTLVTSCQRTVDAGLNVVEVLTVLDREEGGAENLAKAGFKLRAIFTRKSLLEAAK